MASASSPPPPPSISQDLLCFVFVAFTIEFVLHVFNAASVFLDLLSLFLVVFIFRHTRTRFGFVHICTAASFDADALEFAGRALRSADPKRRFVEETISSMAAEGSHSRASLAAIDALAATMSTSARASVPVADEMIEAAAKARIDTAVKFHEEIVTSPSSLLLIAFLVELISFLTEAHACVFFLYSWLAASMAYARNEEERTGDDINGDGRELDVIKSLSRDLDSYAEVLVAFACFAFGTSLFLFGKPVCFLCMALVLWLILGIELAHEARARLLRIPSYNTSEEDSSRGDSSGHGHEQLQEDDESIPGWTIIER